MLWEWASGLCCPFLMLIALLVVAEFNLTILQEGLSLSVLGAGPGVSHLVPGVCPVGQAQVAVEGRLGARGSQRLHDSLEVEFGTFDRLPCQMLPSWSWRFRIMWIRYPILFFLLSLSLSFVLS